MMNKILVFVFLAVLQGICFAKFPVTVVDDDGKSFTFLSPPKKIISTMPSNTEMLFMLGLKDSIIGVTTQCNFPADARTKEKIGGTSLNAEKITSLNPDIIFMLGDAQRLEINRLKSYGLPVFVVNPHTLYELMNSVWMIGNATGKEQKALEITNKIRAELNIIYSRHKQKIRAKILVVIWPDPLVTAGRGTLINDIIWIAGGTNIAVRAKGQYPMLGFEQVIKENPDLIIVSGKSKADIERLKSDKRWQMIEAVWDNRIILIDSDIITRPGPRVMKALDIITTMINNKSKGPILKNKSAIDDYEN